ncbi:guanine deaminase [Biostraticola tofi]|uniref:Guanine deaminase n=1 Tax=Biostraticola tofi TaxID=466109 RepID=A0A4R3YS78_9GAMM|nr:guanine deaminase [Biostraticola tofi]TCV95236.1 guanine deaminase [Biostraticola tofi]
MSPKRAISPFALRGTVFTASNAHQLHCIENALVCVDENGVITAVLHQDDTGYSQACQHYQLQGQLTVLEPGQYVLPGFVDLHVHAPQWPQTGKALDLPLNEWLQDNTFPLEARYADIDFARQVYLSLVDTLLANGTTTAMYFATLHDRSSLELARICLEKGQRALVGRVAMDNPDQCPDYYRDESATAAIEATARFIDDVYQLPGNTLRRVRPVITPRFIPSCTDELLTGLGALARRSGCHVQTHCSESDWEHQYVQQRHHKNDTQALNDFGLITRKTVLAHANFLNDEDMDTLKAAGAGVAHCPLSNFYFSNAVFPLRKALERHLHVGLGSDLSGGHSPSMFDSCRHAITASNALHDGVDPAIQAASRGNGSAKIDFRQAFWLATGGGGEALDLPIGQIKTGYAFDALMLDCRATEGNVVIWPELDSSPDILQKIIYNAARSNIIRTWVQGELVFSR